MAGKKLNRNAISHMMVGTPFLILIISGGVILLSRFWDLGPGAHRALRLIHLATALAWIGLLMVSFLFFRSGRTLSNLSTIFIWGRSDLKWLAMSGRFLFRTKIDIPDPSIFKTRQKINYLLTIFHLLGFGISGLLMWQFNTILLSWYFHVSLFFMTLSMIAGRLYQALTHRKSKIGFGNIFHGLVPGKYLKYRGMLPGKDRTDLTDEEKEAREVAQIVTSFVRTDIILLIITIMVGGFGVAVFNEGRKAALGKSFGSNILTPRKLSGVHQLQEIDDCVKCHDYAGQIRDIKCLECHKLVKNMIESKTGLHGKHGKDKACRECHKEHPETGGKIDPLDEKKFNHDESVYKLKDKHADVKCKDCHKKRQRTKEMEGGYWLGMKFEICVDCHKDPHKDQFKKDKQCGPCHNIKSWRGKELKFDHNKDSKYRLEGKHADIKCPQCHIPGEMDASAAMKRMAALAKKLDLSADVKYGSAQFKDMKFKLCTDCHEDPHKGQFKDKQCTPCHTIKSWREKDLKFDHNKDSKYKLESKHADVKCVECHIPGEKDASAAIKKIGKLPKKPEIKKDTKYSNAQFTGMKYKECTDCHEDPHKGQFKDKKCTPCHTIKSWREKDLKFDHTKDSKYKLESKHADVKCVECHIPGEKDASAAIKKIGKLPKKPEIKKDTKYSNAQFTGMKYKECTDCHEDPHKGQFKDKQCTPCHTIKSWREKDLKFDHSKDSKYKLDGKHADMKCWDCHIPDEKDAGAAMRKLTKLPKKPEAKEAKKDVKYATAQFKDMKFKLCTDCHDDPHKKKLGGACEYCHTTKNWEKKTKKEQPK